MNSPNEPEPDPKKNNGIDVWPLVIADMTERNVVGTAKYGTPLQTDNGRDPLVDSYQEALDLVVYLRQAIEERRERQRIIGEVFVANGKIRGVDRIADKATIEACIAESTWEQRAAIAEFLKASR